MIKKWALILPAATSVVVFSGASPAFAQAPQAQQAQAPVPDPVFETAKRAFEALPEAQRRALQEGLVWTGDFNGVVGGAFGRNTRAAIIAFARRSGLPVDGTLDDNGRAMLAAAAQITKTNVGFARMRDPRSGASMGLPAKILVRRADTASGSRWSAADNAVTLETMQSKESDGNLQSLFEKLIVATPTRRVTYKFSTPAFIVVSGEMDRNTFYTRIARGEVSGAGVLRGYTLTYPASAKGNDRVSIAIANSFEPFPQTAPAGVAASAPTGAAPSLRPSPPPTSSAPPAPRPSVVASGVAVSADRVVTALARCGDPKIGARPARIIKQDEANGLMLLEAQGLNARALAPSSVALTANAPVVVLYQAARAIAGNGAPAAEMMAASGDALASPPRVLAPLQAQAAGGAVFDRNGGFVALVAPLKTPIRVAGVMPQAAWPLVEASALAGFLATNGVTLKPLAAATAQTTADIAAAAQGALYPVICTQ